jgi:asparagine synthase (glutamine-hydrolysing)
MPGTSLLCDMDSGLLQRAAELSQAANEVIYGPMYKQRNVEYSANLFMTVTSYPEYPFETIETDDHIFHIEGRIYGKTRGALTSELSALSTALFGTGEWKNTLLRWVLSSDGEFLITIIEKRTESVFLLNDALGRLPTYYRRDANEIAVSRELGFIQRLIPQPELDRLALAQYLLFRYTFGQRTLLKGVQRLPPFSLVHLRPRRQDIRVFQYSEHNLDVKHDSRTTVGEHARELARLFTEACRSRALAGSHCIVGLSGGLDSRSVAAGLCKAGMPVRAASRLNADVSNAADVHRARQVAKALNIEHTVIKNGTATWAQLSLLLKLKRGLNYLGVGFMVPFLEAVREQYGPGIMYMTGDGGDKVLPNLRSSCVTSFHTALTALMDQQVFSVKQVSRLIGISEENITGEIHNVFTSYPEQEWSNKLVHSIVFERGVKFVGEGEDRNRYFLWCSTPFYGMAVFNYAMKCADSQKDNYSLYKEFLREINQDIAEMPSDKFVPTRSGGYKRNALLNVRGVASRMLPHELKRYVKRLMDKKPDLYVRCVREQLQAARGISEYFQVDELSRLTGKVSEGQAVTILTVTALSEYLSTGRTVLDRYSEQPVSI